MCYNAYSIFGCLPNVHRFALEVAAIRVINTVQRMPGGVNGSTRDFGSRSGGSNPPRAKRILDEQGNCPLYCFACVKEQRMRWLALPVLLVILVGCTEGPPWTDARYTKDYKARIEQIVKWAMEEQKKIAKKAPFPDSDTENSSTMGPTEEKEIGDWWESCEQDPEYYLSLIHI